MASFRQEYRTIKLNILRQQSLSQGIMSFFQTNDLRRIKKYVPALCKESAFRKALSGTLFPDSVDKLGDCGTMPYFLNLDRSLLWFTSVLKASAKEINSFLVQKAEFDHMFLLGQYDKCLALLDALHSQFGWSMWEIRKRIVVLNERDGLSMQKKFVKDVLSKSEIGTIMYYLVTCFSMQCERNVSVHMYLNSIQVNYNQMKSQGYRTQMYKYIKYKAQGYIMCAQFEIDFLDDETIGYFLYEDSGYALIDRYLSFFAMASDIYEQGSEKLRSTFLPYIIDLGREIQDPFLHNIVYLAQKHYPPFYTKDIDSVCQAYDSYVKGDYRACLDIAGNLLRRDIAFFPMVEIYAKSSTYLPEYLLPLIGEDTVLNKIVDQLRRLFMYSEDIMLIQTGLIKLLYTQSDTTWSKELLMILNRHNCRVMVFEEVQQKNLFSSISAADSVFLFPAEFLEPYLSEAPPTYQNSVATHLAVAVRTGDLDKLSACSIESIRKTKYQASLLVETDPQEALEILNQVRKQLEPGARRLENDALRIVAHLELGNMLEAMNIFFAAFYENHNFIYIGSIDRIFQNIKAQNHDTQDSILTPIICSLYFNYYSQHDDWDNIIWTMCYEEYLRAHNVQRPSALLPIIQGKVSDANLIHFLAEVCIPNVMEQSLAFHTYDEVLQERSFICEELIKRDPCHAMRYRDELHCLTKRRLTRMAKQKIESGKIYVDLEGIRQLLSNETCERYNRYVDFQERNITDFELRFMDFRENCESENIHCFFTGKDTKQIDMLGEIVRQIRDIFVADNKYGLDCCLSVRIRHGILESQLRSCFERHNLITDKSAGGAYKENRFWYTSALEPDILKTNDNAFSLFSTHVDDIIKTLKTDMLQIRTERKHPKALFDFTINRNFLECIGARIHSDFTFETFVDMILQEMLNMTYASLKNVQEVLEKQIDVQFQTVLIELENSLVGRDCDCFDFRGLRDAIAKVRTEISSEIKYVSQWFRLTQTDSYSDYQLSLAVSISHELIENSHSGCALIYEKFYIDEDIKLRGQTLPNVVDIFNILFDNVIKHSDLQNEFHIWLSVCREGDQVLILMKNRVKQGCLSPTCLKQMVARLNNWDQSDYINTEGGSGLYKIMKILSIDLHSESSIVINCTDDIYSIEIRAELKDVLL
ncbi:MAG: hypothetical protein HDR05_05500 [Lachnospiraceae bacterium]|nr:hypothetical protein [Lachnospiraceae bacterium]